MHKIKKAIERLEDHLGRDSAGVALLGDIASIADAMRKEASAAKDRASHASACRNALDADLRAAKADNASKATLLEQANARLDARGREIAAHKATIAALRDELEATMPEAVEEPLWVDSNSEVDDRTDYATSEELPPLVRKSKDFTEAFNAVCRRWRTSPTLVAYESVEPQCVLLENMARNYSGAELLDIGRLVVVRAMLNAPIAVVAAATFVNTTLRGQKLNTDHMLSTFVKWDHRNIDWSNPRYN